jgi:hypothetical protein
VADRDRGGQLGPDQVTAIGCHQGASTALAHARHDRFGKNRGAIDIDLHEARRIASLERAGKPWLTGKQHVHVGLRGARQRQTQQIRRRNRKAREHRRHKQFGPV